MQKGFYNLMAVMFIIFGISFACFSSVYSQSSSGTVLFLTTTSATTDQTLIDKLSSWGYTVEVNTTTDWKAGIPSDAELADYKFMFVSEAVSSGDLARLRGGGGSFTTGWLPIPTVNTDNWCSRVSALGLVPASTGYGSIDGNITIVDGTGSPLAAGFSQGTGLSLTTGTTSATATDQNTYVTPDPSVNIIPIAASSQDQTKIVVLGVETGTAVFNSSGVNDGSLVTTARYASVGIHALAFPNITDDGWKLIQAAINWVTDTGTDVDEVAALPTDYVLNQNFPNPFNPTTKITYSIPKESRVKLEVFDILGRSVSTLTNETQQAGIYSVDFNASNLTSGIYVYSLTTSDKILTGKMMLLK